MMNDENDAFDSADDTIAWFYAPDYTLHDAMLWPASQDVGAE